MLDSRRAQRQALAWPTLGLAAVSFLTWGAMFGLGVQGWVPAGVVIATNAVCCYTIYITVHDAAHGAFAKAPWINDWLGRVCILLITPFIAFSAFRHLHLQHHRATNEPDDDPDMWASGSRWWSLALRFATLDMAYWVFYLRRIRTRPRLEVLESVVSLGASLSILAALWRFGLGRELLLFWILPGRISIFFLAWLLDYMPHRPHGVTQRTDAFQATNVRVGAERWLSPLLLWQNYHLVHHLYPREPFYLTVVLWREKERWHLDRGARLVDVWGRSLTAPAHLAAREREAEAQRGRTKSRP